MFGRRGRGDASRDQPRDVRGRFGETHYSRADTVDLNADPADAPATGSFFEGPGCDELRVEGATAHEAVRAAERFEAVRLPEDASALDGAIAEAAVSSLWLGRPRGPLAAVLGEAS